MFKVTTEDKVENGNIKVNEEPVGVYLSGQAAYHFSMCLSQLLNILDQNPQIRDQIIQVMTHNYGSIIGLNNFLKYTRVEDEEVSEKENEIKEGTVE